MLQLFEMVWVAKAKLGDKYNTDDFHRVFISLKIKKTTLEESLYDEMRRTHFVGQETNKMESHCFVPDNACIY